MHSPICKIVLTLLSIVSVGKTSFSREKRQAMENTFADDFIFGTSTASYQVEGAWDVDGKGWSSWDYLARTNSSHVLNNDNGDVAGSSYYLYKRDVEMLKELGVKAYRFSISWPRILPYGRSNYIEERGVAYYDNLINELLANDILPFATMYHWDMPQNMAEQGGWMNEDSIDWFGDYARVLYQRFGDRVKHWMTINEPRVHCAYSYGGFSHAPQYNDPAVGFYECGRQILLANARAYHIYADEFKAAQGGEVGIVLDTDWPIAATPEDQSVVDSHMAFLFGQYADPIFSDQGNYPQIMIDRIANNSAEEGFISSRLRPFSQEQIEYIKGTSDFLALNHYSTNYVYRNQSTAQMFEVPSYQHDMDEATFKDPYWPTTSASWITEYAPGLYYLLNYIKDTYNNPKIYITENGCATPPGLNDTIRVQYVTNYLNAVLDAINDGSNVQGYFVWSLMDNFEWAFGYSLRFGMYEVDYEHPNRTRTAKKSALVYKDIISKGYIDFSYDPDPYAVTDGALNFKASLFTTVLTVLLYFVI